ncbi:hypothetical protein [uncultured Methanobrevibacter sp.]|uniref:hypothetical protein n=1 Tax=uncultured Methanobrevibacter sp. TaxID=253161 RepID=UPI0025EA6E67|nr:hypothetical protein [uncultured Methanobrevibacter sp.]
MDYNNILEELDKWYDTLEGQKHIEEIKRKSMLEEKAKKRFADRVLSMSIEEQDNWMKKIIARYNSESYTCNWYNRGIFPPNWLFDRIREFIFDNGMEVDKDEDGSPIYQYNHWKMNLAYGQGQCHHEFTFTTDKPHRYGEDIFYVIRHVNRSIHTLDNILLKRWDDAKYIIDEFVQSCKNNGITSVVPAEFEIVEITLQNPKNIVEKIDTIVKQGNL